jgi:Z1 domain-containing protein
MHGLGCVESEGHAMANVRTDGPIFTAFKKTQNPPLAADTAECSIETVTRLLQTETANDRPGMLLGQVQSGKTRAFVGAVALAFDNGVDVAVIFTKGTRALTKQTLVRIRRDLRLAIQQELVTAHDIKVLPNNLTSWDLARKVIIVCKKEDDNVKKLKTTLTDTYPDLAKKRLLIVDDEADFASVGFRRKRGSVELNVIPTKIDDIRQALALATFLQVTATPYSLYLQPETLEVRGQGVFLPVRPAFTVQVPVHPGYVGGEFYFEQSRREGSTASFLHVTVSDAELLSLRTPQSLSLTDDLLTSPALTGMRRAIVTFIVGGWIRRRQQQEASELPDHYSFIVHTHTSKTAHAWQRDVVKQMVDQLQRGCNEQPLIVRQLVSQAYADLSDSLTAEGMTVPPLDEIEEELNATLDGVMVTTVNSERQIDELLDENGELHRRNPYNIFVGGQILDRGVTIDRLIGFFYGRSPNRSQQDTVLQHSRMYGNRERADLAVTRFHTTTGIYNVMRTIYEIDTALRAALAATGPDHGVVFLQTDARGRVIPCSPNKILVSQVTALRPNSNDLPIGFSTTADAAAMTQQVDERLHEYDSDGGHAVPVEFALELIDLVGRSIKPDAGRDWDVDAFKGSIKHLAENARDGEKGQVWMLVRQSRNYAKRRQNGRLQDYPATQGDEAILAGGGSRPRLLLNRQSGSASGWSGSDFWWPMLFAPPTTRPVIFAHRKSV